MTVESLPRCAECNGEMPPARATGRPRRYCSAQCRERAKTRRRGERNGGWQALAAELADIPADPLTHRQRTLEAIAELLEGAPAAPPEDQLAQALIEAQQLAFSLRRIADDVAPSLRARALGLHQAIVAGLARHFREVTI